jgi:hypothetical protein
VHFDAVLRVRELAELARRLDATAFAVQMGPFALMQRPGGDIRADRGRLVTVGLPQKVLEQAPAPVEFEELMVATLPPPLPDGTMELVIGRSPDADLVVEDPAVSSRHAAIRWDGEQAVIVDLGSANGTFVNSKKLSGYAPLSNGDQLGFGRAHFIFLPAAELHARIRRSIHVGG